MAIFSRRLTHVVTRKDLALVVAPTYAKAARVDFDEAHERMQRAVENPRVLERLYQGLSDALFAFQGARTTEDELIDKLSAGMQARRARVQGAELSSALSAAMVMIDIELGYSPEMMRDALQTPKGKKLLEDGLKALGLHLLKQLIK